MFRSPLKAKSIIDVALCQQGNDSDVIELIKNIYPKIKSEVDLFDESINFNTETKPAEFLTHILNCYKKVKETSYDQFVIKNKQIYDVLEYDYNNNFYCIPVKPLLQIKKKNKWLYYNLLDAVNALLHIDFSHYEEGPFEYELEYHKDMYKQEEDTLEKKEIGKNLKVYSGPAKKMLEEIKAPKPVFHPKINTKQEQDLVDWAKEVRHKALFSQKRLSDYWISLQCDEEELKTPDSQFLIVWDLEDPIFEAHFHSFNESVGNYGIIPLRKLQCPSDKSVDSFPNEIAELVLDYHQFIENYLESIEHGNKQ